MKSFSLLTQLCFGLLFCGLSVFAQPHQSYGTKITFYEESAQAGSPTSSADPLLRARYGLWVPSAGGDAKWVWEPNMRIALGYEGVNLRCSFELQVYKLENGAPVLVYKLPFSWRFENTIANFQVKQLLPPGTVSGDGSIYYLYIKNLPPDGTYDQYPRDASHITSTVECRFNLYNLSYVNTVNEERETPVGIPQPSFPFYFGVPDSPGPTKPYLQGEDRSEGHDWGLTHVFDQVGANPVTGAISGYHYSLKDNAGTIIGDTVTARIWELYKVDRQNQSAQFIRTLSQNQNHDDPDPNVGPEQEIYFQSPVYQEGDENLYLVYCRTFNAYNEASDEGFDTTDSDSWANKTFLFQVGPDYASMERYQLAVGWERSLSLGDVVLANTNLQEFESGWLFTSPVDTTTYYASETRIRGGDILTGLSTHYVYHQTQMVYATGQTDTYAWTQQDPQTIGQGMITHNSNYFSGTYVDTGHYLIREYGGFQLRWRLDTPYGITQWSPPKQMDRGVVTVPREHLQASIHWQSQPGRITPGAEIEVDLDFENEQDYKKYVTFWLAYRSYSDSNYSVDEDSEIDEGDVFQGIQMAAYPSGRPGMIEDQCMRATPGRYTLIVPEGLPTDESLEYFVRMKVQYTHFSNPIPCNSLGSDGYYFLPNFRMPAQNILKQLIEETTTAVGVVLEPGVLENVQPGAFSQNPYARVFETSGGTDVFFNETRSGDIQPERVFWTWQTLDSNRYWVNGAWVSLAEGETPPVVEIGTGMIESGGTDPFSAAWSWDRRRDGGTIHAGNADPFEGMLDAFFGDTAGLHVKITFYMDFPNQARQTDEVSVQFKLVQLDRRIRNLSLYLPGEGEREHADFDAEAVPNDWRLWAELDGSREHPLYVDVRKADDQGQFQPLFPCGLVGGSSPFTIQSGSVLANGNRRYVLRPSTALLTALAEPGRYRVTVGSEACVGGALLGRQVTITSLAAEAPAGRLIIRFHYRDHLGSTSVSRAYGGMRDPAVSGVPISLSLTDGPVDLYPQSFEFTRFTPFGEPVASVSNSDRPRYTDHEFDTESGFNYMKARFQIPEYGRFNRPDPARDYVLTSPLTINLYQYVRNNPVMALDPEGEVAHVVVGTLGGAAVGGVASGLVSIFTQTFDKGAANIDWKEVGAKAANGAVSGAITGLAASVGGPFAAPLAETAAAAIGDVAGGMVERAIIGPGPNGTGRDVFDGQAILVDMTSAGLSTMAALKFFPSSGNVAKDRVASAIGNEARLKHLQRQIRRWKKKVAQGGPKSAKYLRQLQAYQKEFSDLQRLFTRGDAMAKLMRDYHGDLAGTFLQKWWEARLWVPASEYGYNNFPEPGDPSLWYRWQINKQNRENQKKKNDEDDVTRAVYPTVLDITPATVSPANNP